MKHFGIELAEGTTTTNLSVPVLTSTERDNLLEPNNGEIIYQTTSPAGLYYYSEAVTSWLQVTPVTSVNTRIGDIVLTSTDVDLANVTNDKQLKDSQTVSITGDVTANATKLNTGTIETTLSNTGVITGTYKSVTVDAKGRVTNGSNPTTLSGYGITDAISNNNTLPLTYSNITSNSFQTTDTTEKQAIDSTDISQARSIKYCIQVSSGTKYHVIELLVLHNDIQVFINDYNEIYTEDTLGIFDASIVSNSIVLQFTPIYQINTIKLFKIILSI